MSLFSRPIVVTFEDAQTGQVFATVKQKPEQLPETFELETTLHIGDDEWSVVEERPAHRAPSSANSRGIIAWSWLTGRDARGSPRIIPSSRTCCEKPIPIPPPERE